MNELEDFLSSLRKGRAMAGHRQEEHVQRQRKDREAYEKALEIAQPLSSVIVALSTLPEDDRKKTFRSYFNDRTSRLIGSIRYDSASRPGGSKHPTDGLAVIVDSSSEQLFNIHKYSGVDQRKNPEGPFSYAGNDPHEAAAAVLRWAGFVAPERVEEIAEKLPPQ